MENLLVENLSISHWLSAFNIWLYVTVPTYTFFKFTPPRDPITKWTHVWSKRMKKSVILSLSCIHLHFFHFRKQINNFQILSSRIISFHFYLFRWKSLFIFVCLWKTVQIGFLLFQKGFHFPKGFNLVSTLLMNLDKNKNEFSPRIPSKLLGYFWHFF